MSDLDAKIRAGLDERAPFAYAAHRDELIDAVRAVLDLCAERALGDRWVTVTDLHRVVAEALGVTP